MRSCCVECFDVAMAIKVSDESCRWKLSRLFLKPLSAHLSIIIHNGIYPKFLMRFFRIIQQNFLLSTNLNAPK